MKEKKEMNAKSFFHGRRALILGVALLILMLVVVIGTTYAIYVVNLQGKEKNEVSTGTLSVDFKGKNNAISLTNTYPMSDEEGLRQEGFQFSIVNSGTLDANYRITLEEATTSTFPKEYLKYVFYEEGTTPSTPALLSTLPSGLVLKENSTIQAGEEQSFVLKLWIAESAGNDVQGKTFQGKIVVESVQTTEGLEDTVAPMIQLNGEYTMNINKDSTFIDPGIKSITDNSGEEILESSVTKIYEYYDGTNVTTVDTVDTSKVGAYTIYYRVSDSVGNQGIVARSVNVNLVNTQAPTITGTNLTVRLGEPIVYNYYAYDSLGNDITSNVTVITGNVDTTTVGIYLITYYVVDRDGNIGSATGTLTIQSNSIGGGAQYTITATATDGGTIEPAGQIKVKRNVTQIFKIIPNEGYSISDVIVDGMSVGPVTSYSFPNVRQHHTIEVRFAAK